MLERVLGRAQIVEELSGKQMDFGVACNKAKVTIEEVMPLILDGTVKWLGRRKGVSGMAALLVDLEELLDLFEGPPLTGYTQHDLKRMLRVNDPTISFLVKNGFIEAQDTRHPRSRRPMKVVTSETYEAFLERFVSLGILANQMGTQAKHVSSKLERLKIDPIQMASRFSKIYERQHLKGVIDQSGWIIDPATSKASDFT